MAAYEISRREVLNNLIRFKDSLLEKKLQKSKERIYKVLLNCKTGDMRFPQKIKSLEYSIARKKGRGEAPNDWKEARIMVTDHFELQNVHNQRMEPTEVDPLAWRIIRETFEVLNLRAKEIKEGGLPEEAVLRDLSSIHLSTPVDRIEDLPAWVGKLDRERSEKKLEGKLEGTYLIREGDPLTQAIGFHIAEENHTPVRTFLLTLVEEEEKISDILLLQTDKGWTQYFDDPNLLDLTLYQYESSPEVLLSKLHGIAKKPISREEL